MRYCVNELYHHGVKGMKWGVRHEYEKKGRLTKSNNDDSISKTHKGLTNKQKKALKIGAIAVGTALAAYGGYRLVSSGKLNAFAKTGKAAIQNIYAGSASSSSKLDSVAGFKKLSSWHSADKDAAVCSLERNEILASVGGNYDLLPNAWKNNCANSSIAWCLRRLGYDVKPNPINVLDGATDIQYGVVQTDVFDMFKPSSIGAAVKATSRMSDSHDLAERAIKSCGGDKSGAFGMLFGTGDMGGHFMTWENDHGTIHILNPQKDDLQGVEWGFENFQAVNVSLQEFNDNYRNLHDPDLAFKRLKTMASGG